jgi:N-acetylglutamate synthase-like GNAT family acetyltransferase
MPRPGSRSAAGRPRRCRTARTEVAGIAVRAAYRRRGVGAAITAWLTAAVHDRGAHTVFLTPAGVDEKRLYEGVGYQAADDMLHLRLS